LVACALASGTTAGCLGTYDARDDAPTTTTTSFFGTPSPDVSQEIWVAYPPGVSSTIDSGRVSARLDGQLANVTLGHATTQNNAYLDSWNGGGHLNLDVAAQGVGGAGMIILGLPGGLSHPVFETGFWSSADDQAMIEAALSGAPEQYVETTAVRSCAGPVLGDYPFEETAISYEMTSEPDPQDPSIVVLVVRSTFPVPYALVESGQLDAAPEGVEVVATIRLDGLDELADAAVDEPAGPTPSSAPNLLR
jgi:hypothetical protein